jgi:thiol-disulfide isomerase/thioredoxin
MARTPALAAISLTAVALGLAACGGSDSTSSASTSHGPLATYTGPAIGTVIRSPEPSPAPALAGTDPITGRHVSLAQFAGKPVVVNFWASSCFPCNQEAPALLQLARAHPEAVVLGVDTTDSDADARRFYAKWHLTHASIADPHGDLAASYAVPGLPTTVFLTASHRIVGRVLGRASLATFELGLSEASGTP